MVDVPVLGTGVLWRVGSSPTKGNPKNEKNLSNKNIYYLALNYFSKRPPSKYRRPLCVSLLSSGWNKVVQHKHEH